jgi:hypothetical protein
LVKNLHANAVIVRGILHVWLFGGRCHSRS